MDMFMKFAFLFVIMFSIIVSACGSGIPTAATTVEPTNTTAPNAKPTSQIASTETPVTSGDPTWDRVQTNGKIVVGTSAD